MDAKRLLRNGAARLLFASGLTSPSRQARQRLSIVTFHRVLPEEERRSYPYPGLVVTPQELDHLLAYFTRHFDCGTVAAQHQRHLAARKTTRPLLALSFDDAQYDNHRNARPILARFGVKASFFVPVAALERQELLWHDRLGFAVLHLRSQGRDGQRLLRGALTEAGIPDNGRDIAPDAVARASKHLGLQARLRLVQALEQAAAASAPAFARMMTYTELAQLVAEGHEIGSHSMTHCMMTECDDDSLRYELVESRRILQQRLGCQVETFCYPNGNCDARTALAVSQAGYLRGVTTAWGDNGPETETARLRRFDMDARRMCDSRGNLSSAAVALRMSRFTRYAMGQAT